MTVVTVIAAGDVKLILADRNRIVVARHTRTDNLRVIDGVRRYPGDIVVAVLAYVRGLNMRQIFAGRLHAVMAANTIVDDGAMVEGRRYPCGRRMTIVTGVDAGDMRRMLADCDGVVMAGGAGTDNLGVIDRVCRHKDDAVVTVFAYIGGLDVRRRLAGRFHAVVATDAVAHDIDMIEVGRNPRRRCMAIITGIATDDVRRIFAGRNRAVVTGRTGADYLRVVHDVRRHPEHAVVAVLAHGRGLNMGGVLAGRVRAVMAARAITGDADVIEIRRDPGDRRMAVVAGIAAQDM